MNEEHKYKLIISLGKENKVWDCYEWDRFDYDNFILKVFKDDKAIGIYNMKAVSSIEMK